MKSSIILGTLAVLVAAGSATAAPRFNADRGRVTGWERAQIAQSAAHLAAVKRRAYADGRVTFYERFQIRRAEASYNATVRRARRS